MTMTTETAEVAVEPGLTPAEKRHLVALERRIEQGLQTFREVGVALLEIRDSRLYRDGHSTFEDYCRAKWQLDRTRAYQFIGAAEVVKMLGDPKALTNESQARELVTVMRDDPTAVKTIWRKVEEKVKAGAPAVTAQLIREVKAEVMSPDGPPPAPSLADSIVASVTRLISQYRRWEESKPGRKERAMVNAAFAKLDEVTGG